MIIKGKPVSIPDNSAPLEFTPAGPGRLPEINTLQMDLDKLMTSIGAERGKYDGRHLNGATYVYVLTREQLVAVVRQAATYGAAKVLSNVTDGIIAGAAEAHADHTLRTAEVGGHA